jgi:hypothetical protein
MRMCRGDAGPWRSKCHEAGESSVMKDRRFPPRLHRIRSSSGLLCEMRWFETDVSGLPIGPIFKGQSTAQRGPGPPHARGFEIRHTDTPQSVGILWTSDRPVTETSTLRTFNTHKGQTSMLLPTFETATPASDRPQTLAIDRSATGIGFERKILRRILVPVCENDLGCRFKTY